MNATIASTAARLLAHAFGVASPRDPDVRHALQSAVGHRPYIALSARKRRALDLAHELLLSQAQLRGATARTAVVALWQLGPAERLECLADALRDAREGASRA